jgi:RNA polymerase sigma factor (sigma-70 family)
VTVASMPPPSDAELVAAAAGGDKQSFAVLLARHRHMAHAVAARVLRDADLARDATQEAAVVALVSLDRLRQPDRFGSWLCGIALNVARRWARELEALSPVAELDAVAHQPGPEDVAEAVLSGERVRRAVASLAPGQREAVLLFYLRGLSHREVAAELGISVGAVKARLHQARTALAPRLASEMPEMSEMSEMTEMSELEEEITMTTTTPTDRSWVDVSVAGVRAGDDDPLRRPHVVVLEDGAGRQLPIWIGPAEATALALSLESEDTPRPMTHQLAAGLLEAAEARVTEVRITQLVEQTFYGTTVVESGAGTREVDARPSDALNLALVTGAPIRVDSALLDEAAAAGRTQWQRYPISAGRLVAEMRERFQEAKAALAAETPE